MSRKSTVTKAPYFPNGSLMHYPSSWDDADWRDIVPFTARLTLACYTRGYSAAFFLLLDEQNREYPMFLTDFTELVQQRACIRGRFLLSTYTVQKRGQNYGIRLVRPEETRPAA